MGTDLVKEGKYIYCIIRNSCDINFGGIGIGVRHDAVYGVAYRDICAVVSSSPVVQYEARRANMIAHQRVLEEVMKKFNVLPVRFSTISPHDNDEAIIRILTEEYARLDELLNKMKGKKELGLKVMAIETKIYEYIILKYDNIRSLRDKLINQPPDKIHYKRIKIGEMVADALKEEIESFKNQILDTLNQIADDVKITDNYGDLMILNAAFLIKEINESLFDAAVNNLDKKYGDIMTFKYVGTLPPYNFVNLSINTKGD
ncbi:MAG: GvpL/GvpF family gas vesicle protein [Chlorobium sp.]|nr:MAG: GvpL/GvpF family gas vesicle protein [Chlorobium sp.]